MCLVSVLPKGTVKFSDEVVSFIKNGAESNNQGSGYAFKKSGSNLINVNKGFFNVDALIEAYKNENLEVDDEVIIHHRIGTQGRIDDENCHPFVVSSDLKECVQIQTTTDKPVLAHNGMFRNLTKYDVNGYSDTFSFANGLMSIPQIMDLYMNNKSEFEKLFKDILGYSKVVFLFPDRDLMMSGEFHEDNGYYHSNSGYKSWVVDVGGSSFYEKKSKAGISVQKSFPIIGCSVTKAPIIGTKKNGIPSLTGHYLIINENNMNHFIYRLKSNFNKKSILSKDEYYELDNISGDYYFTFKMISNPLNQFILNYDQVHNDLQFIPKNKKYDMYSDYLYLIDSHSRTQSGLKKLKKIYFNTSKQTNDTRVFCKTLGIPVYRESIKLFLEYLDIFKEQDIFVL